MPIRVSGFLNRESMIDWDVRFKEWQDLSTGQLQFGITVLPARLRKNFTVLDETGTKVTLPGSGPFWGCFSMEAGLYSIGETPDEAYQKGMESFRKKGH